MRPAHGAACQWRHWLDKVTHLHPLRMIGHHEGLGNDNLVARTGGNQVINFRSFQRNRFLAQHMLAGIRAFDGPFHMLRGRQRNVDAVNVRVCQHGFIGTIGLFRTKLRGQSLRFGQIARGDSVKYAVIRLNNARNDMLAANLGRKTEYPSET